MRSNASTASSNSRSRSSRSSDTSMPYPGGAKPRSRNRKTRPAFTRQRENVQKASPQPQLNLVLGPEPGQGGLKEVQPLQKGSGRHRIHRRAKDLRTGRGTGKQRELRPGSTRRSRANTSLRPRISPEEDSASAIHGMRSPPNDPHQSRREAQARWSNRQYSDTPGTAGNRHLTPP